MVAAMPRICAWSLAALAACGGGESSRATKPRPTDSPSPPRYSARTLTPELVHETISTTYMPQLRRCYQLFIKKEPAARGRVTLTFTVDAVGKVIEARADGIASEERR
jgi:hypothetical protein